MGKNTGGMALQWLDNSLNMLLTILETALLRRQVVTRTEQTCKARLTPGTCFNQYDQRTIPAVAPVMGIAEAASTVTVNSLSNS